MDSSLTSADFRRSLVVDQQAFERRQAERKHAYAAVVQRAVASVGTTLQLYARAPGACSLGEARRATEDMLPRWNEMFSWSDGRRPEHDFPMAPAGVVSVKKLYDATVPLLERPGAGGYSTAAFSLNNIHCVKETATAFEENAFYVYFNAISECGCAVKSEPTKRELVDRFESPRDSYGDPANYVIYTARIRVVGLCFVHAGQQDPAEELMRCMREQCPELARFLPTVYRFAPLEQALQRWSPKVWQLKEWQRKDLGLTD